MDGLHIAIKPAVKIVNVLREVNPGAGVVVLRIEHIEPAAIVRRFNADRPKVVNERAEIVRNDLFLIARHGLRLLQYH